MAPPLFVNCTKYWTIAHHTHSPLPPPPVSRINSLLMPSLHGWPHTCPVSPLYPVSLPILLSMTIESLCDLADIYLLFWSDWYLPPFLVWLIFTSFSGLPFVTYRRFCSSCMQAIYFSSTKPCCLLALYPCICCSLHIETFPSTLWPFTWGLLMVQVSVEDPLVPESPLYIPQGLGTMHLSQSHTALKTCL